MNSPVHPEAAAAAQFMWPAPPYFEFMREKDRSGWADCVLTLRDGTQAGGQLHSFEADAALLTLQPNGASEIVTIPFSALLKLRLPHPLGLKRETLPDTATAAETEALMCSERYSFRLELVNGEQLLGVTLGYVSALCGLFLYFPEANGDVVRCFVPAQAAKTCTIDAPIGQVLLDQNAVSPEALGVALNLQSLLRSQKLGQYLTQNKIVSPDQLAAALQRKRERPAQRLGEALIELGFISRPELDMALLNDSLERTMPIGQILRQKLGIVDEQAINGAMASKLGIPTVGLKDKIPIDVLGRIPAAVAHRRRVLPLGLAEGALVVAIENPMDSAVLEELRSITRMKILPVSAAAQDISSALNRHYGAAPDAATDAHPAIERRRSGRLLAIHNGSRKTSEGSRAKRRSFQ